MAEAGLVASRVINLAHVAPFRLGQVDVYPATRQLVRGGQRETLEPRVMQVLVALAEAKGEVLTRDELIERCWEGRIVSENAINRVISRLRQAAADFGMDSFQLETITKVGYRIIIAGPGQQPAERPKETAAATGELGFRRSRRYILGAGAVALTAAGGLFFWPRASQHQPEAEALELYRRGQIAQRQGVPEQVRQAVSFFKQATEIDPLYADAWGALALSYRHILEGFTDGVAGLHPTSLPSLIESAARRALALDPANADAQLALVIIKPYFRNWGWMESDLRRLGERFPDHWFVQAQLGIIRYEVGRWRDGLVHTEHQLTLEPFIPIPHINRARALWSLGRLQEADAVLEAAVKRWPAHYGIWSFRYGFLLLSGRPGAALAYVMNPETRPEDLRPGWLEFRTTLARAVERRDPKDIAVSLARLRGFAAEAIQSLPSLAPLFLALGDAGTALSALEHYYLGRGGFGFPVGPPGPFDRRYTQLLFTPDMTSLWPEPRFAALLERIGLERYWRETGTLPDYRRA